MSFYRVLKPGGTATIIVPDGRSQAAWQDPTHQRAFVPRSALYWNQDLQWPKLYGITADFDVELQEYGDPRTEAFLKFRLQSQAETALKPHGQGNPKRPERAWAG